MSWEHLAADIVHVLTAIGIGAGACILCVMVLVAAMVLVEMWIDRKE